MIDRRRSGNPTSESKMIDSSPFLPPFFPAHVPGIETPLSKATAASSIHTLVEAHGDFVWRSLRRLGVPESQADDATQQVFVIAAGKIDSIRDGSERSFLFATLSNVAAHVRRSLARGREQPYAEGYEAVDPAPRADDLMAQQQARALLDEVLEEMPFELRTVFVLFELEELSAPEISDLTGLAVGTVASRLRRARDEFQKAAKRVRAQATPAPGTRSPVKGSRGNT